MKKIINKCLIFVTFMVVLMAIGFRENSYAWGANMIAEKEISVSVENYIPGIWSRKLTVDVYVNDNRNPKYSETKRYTVLSTPGRITVNLKGNSYCIEKVEQNNLKITYNDEQSFYAEQNGDYFNDMSLKIYIYTKPHNVPYTIEYYVNGEKLERATDSGSIVSGEVVQVKDIDDLKISNKYKLKSIYNPKGVKVDEMKIDYYNNLYRVFYSNSYEMMDEIQIKWSRSKEGNNKNNKEYLGAYSSSAHDWNWDVLNSIKHTETDFESVWDGLKGDNKHESGINLPSGNYATWKCTQEKKYDIRRFYGEFEIPEGYTGKDYIKVKPVDHDKYININNGDILPINDNMYVFIYKVKDANGNAVNEINANNYLDYLAFWTGTSNQDEVENIIKPNGEHIDGTDAIQVDKETDEYDLLRHSDGWYCKAPLDNIGDKMADAKPGDKYVIDIFTEEYSGTGGMDRLCIEFVKNTAPTTTDDIFICAAGETMSVEGEYSVLKNDKSNNEETDSSSLKAELIPSNLQKDSNGYLLKDKNNKPVGYLKDFKEDGTFTFTPKDNYNGVTEFKYNCIEGREKTEGKATIYVMPYVEAKHIIFDNGNTIEKDIERMYRWGDNYSWNNSWIWPKKITNEKIKIDDKTISISVTDENNKTGYSFSPKTYFGYKYKQEDSSTPISGNDLNVNNVELHYYPTKSSVYVDFIDEATGNTIRESVSKEFDFKKSYKEYITDLQTNTKIDGYEYLRTEPATLPNNGVMQTENIQIKFYYKLLKNKYTIEYYVDNQLYGEPLTGTEKFGTEINNSVYYIDNKINEINESDEYEGTGNYVELERVENFPCTIKNIENNVIKIFLKKKNSSYNNYFAISNDDVVSIVDNFSYDYCTELNRKGVFEITLSIAKNEQNASGLNMTDLSYKILPIGIKPTNVTQQPDGSCKITVDTSNYNGGVYRIGYKIKITADKQICDSKGWFENTNLILKSECRMIKDKNKNPVDVNIGTVANQITFVSKPVLE